MVVKLNHFFVCVSSGQFLLLIIFPLFINCSIIDPMQYNLLIAV